MKARSVSLTPDELRAILLAMGDADELFADEPELLGPAIRATVKVRNALVKSGSEAYR